MYCFLKHSGMVARFQYYINAMSLFDAVALMFELY